MEADRVAKEPDKGLRVGIIGFWEHDMERCCFVPIEAADLRKHYFVPNGAAELGRCCFTPNGCHPMGDAMLQPTGPLIWGDAKLHQTGPLTKKELCDETSVQMGRKAVGNRNSSRTRLNIPEPRTTGVTQRKRI